MNDPANYQEAWCYRCEKGSYNRTLAKKIKQMMLMAPDGGESMQKLAVLGALSLYLDFINLSAGILSA